MTPAGNCRAGPVTMRQVPPGASQTANGFTLPCGVNVLEHISSLLALLQLGDHSIDTLSRRPGGPTRSVTTPRILRPSCEEKLRFP